MMIMTYDRKNKNLAVLTFTGYGYHKTLPQCDGSVMTYHNKKL
jgi:hypothetical protein